MINTPLSLANSGKTDTSLFGSASMPPAAIAALPMPSPTPRDGRVFRVLTYLRVSREAAEDNHTFETQRQRIAEKLDAVYGPSCWEAEEFCDDGISGAYGPRATGLERRTRPTLRLLQEKIVSGRYDALVVYHTSRLFRSARWFQEWLEDVILPHNIGFYSASEDIDIFSSQGRMMLSWLAVMNASTRETIVQRNRDAAATRAETGYHCGPPPYGWVYEERAQMTGRRRGIVRDEEKSAHVRWMKQRYEQGLSVVHIAGELNERGVPSPRGAQWTAGVVSRTLFHPVHYGFVSSKRRGLLRGRHFEQRLFEPDELERLRALCETRIERFKTNTGRTKQTLLLGGLVCCARCGRRLYRSGSEAYPSYRCENGRDQGERTCRDVTARSHWLEGAVLNYLERLAMDSPLRDLLEREAEAVAQATAGGHEQQVKALERALQEVQTREKRLLDALGRGLINDDDYRASRQGLNDERAILQRDLDKHRGATSVASQVEFVKTVRETVLRFAECWEHLEVSERRHLLSTLLERLELDREGRDAVITLKVHMLPVETIRIPFESTRHMKAPPTGVASLTPRQLVFLHHHSRGLSRREIAREMGTNYSNACQFPRLIRERLGFRDLNAAYQLAKPRIDLLLPHLPLGSPRSRGVRQQNQVENSTQSQELLSATLMEVFPLLASGANTREVARITSLSPTTIAGRRSRILEILEVRTIFEATTKARQLNLL